ncbi:MAG TPA: type IV pili methyl-accepting chemotaxis transducer N-terminal domain-containing protein, partial [Tahibacter sp.]|nr:type IV pili methyl-accepting chemotaxis transducer N-terminal domain-containing protein [Tahibacter sp.]
MSTTSGAVKERASGTNTWLIILLLLALAVAAVDFFLLNKKNNDDRQAVALTTQIQVLSQSIAKYASESAGGNIDAFKELEATRNNIDKYIQALNRGDEKEGMPGYAEEAIVSKQLQELSRSWAALNTNATKILGNKELVLSSAATASDFSGQIPILNSRMDEVVNILTNRSGSTQQVQISMRQMLLADRMIRRVQEILLGGQGAQSAADGFSRDARLYGAVLNGLINGSPDFNIKALDNANGREILTDIYAKWTGMAEPVQKILDSASSLQEVKEAADNIFGDSQTVLLRANDVATKIGELSTKRLFPNVWWGLIAAAVAAALLVVLLIAQARDQRRRYSVTAELNQRNQEAILRLLDEMGSLAEGDLTVKATVTEDITGAIADSVNFAVEALRSLVTT